MKIAFNLTTVEADAFSDCATDKRPEAIADLGNGYGVMNELYEELLFLVASESDTSEATLAAFYDVAIDQGASITLQSCRHCKVLCDPECGACNCIYPPTQYEPEDNGHDLRPEERWCNQCGVAFDEDLHGPWCPDCHGLPIEDIPESPTQVVPRSELLPMTGDDADLPF